MNKKINITKEPVSFEQFGAGGPVLSYIDRPEDVLMKNKMVWAQAKMAGQADDTAMAVDMAAPLINILASSLQTNTEENKTPQAAAGISTENKQVNVEGGELLEDGKGNVVKIKGPKHEAGGVKLSLSANENHNVYSNRITGITGKTLAREKEEREKKITKYEKYIQENPGDIAAKNTLERLKASSKLADQKAIDFQQQIRDTPKSAFNTEIDEDDSKDSPAKEKAEGEIHAATGYSDTERPSPNSLIKILQNYNMSNNSIPVNTEDGIILPDLTPVLPVIKDTDPKLPSPVEKPSTFDLFKKNIRNNYTIGDAIGTVGMMAQNAAYKKGALRNMQSLPNESNVYNKYGQETVQALQANGANIQASTDAQRREVYLQDLLTKRAMDTNSRGIGDKMANMIASQEVTDKAISDIDRAGTASMNANNTEISKLLMSIQNKYDTEQKNIFDRNEQRLDNANRILTAADMATGKMVTEIGKIANEGNLRKAIAEALNSQSKYFQTDALGRTVGKGTDGSGITDVQKQANDAAQKAIQDKAAQDAQAKSTTQAQTTNTGVTTTQPVTPSLVGTKVLPGFDLSENKTALQSHLSSVGLSLDLNNPQSIKDLQTKINLPAKFRTGKFGMYTWEALQKYVTNKGVTVDPSTGIGITLEPLAKKK